MTEQLSTAENLVERVRLGDAKAETEFVRRYFRRIFLMLQKRLGDGEIVAKACTQETLWITIKEMRAGKIRKPERIFAFLRQTSINVSIDHYRKQSRYVAIDEGNIAQLRTVGNTAEGEIYSGQLHSILKEVIDELPIWRDREILNRFFLLEHGKRELCDSLDLSSDQFDQAIYRAKKRIRKILDRNKPLEAFLYSELMEWAEGYE